MIKRIIEYFGVARYINILFILLFLFLIAMLLYKINLHNLELKHERFKTLESFTKELDFSLKEKIEAISYLESAAELFLYSPYSKCQSMVTMVHQAREGNYFTLDDAYHKLLDITDRTKITGYGDLHSSDIDKNELCMALSLNPLLSTIGNHIKDSAWIYYTSKSGFINLFPYVHSDIFRLRKEDMDKECFTYGTPALNPDKSLFWTPLYVDAGGLGLMTSIGKPVYHNREFKGVVALDMTLEHLGALLEGFKDSQGTSLIANAQHQILAMQGIKGFLNDKIIDLKTVLSQEMLASEGTEEDFIAVGDYFFYKKSLANAPWDFIYYFNKYNLYKAVFFKVLPGILIFIFMLFGKVLIARIISTQKELEHLNNTLEEKVKEKVAELEIQKSSYETLFERAGSGICILKDAKIVECNNAFVQMLGVGSKESLIGHYILEFAPPLQEGGKTSLRAGRHFQRELIKNGDYTWEWRGIRRDGALMWMEIVSKIITLNDEKVVQIITQDITKRKILEQQNKEQMNQLLQQSRMAQMGEMLSMISHQWRQPLSSIAMVVMNLEVKIQTGKLLRDSEEASQKSDAFILERTKRIEKYVQYLATTIEDFRNFFKPQKEKKTFMANKLLDETIELINPTLESKRIVVERAYQTSEKIVSYENEIKQVVLNILNNAKDALVEKKVSNPSIMIGTYVRGKSLFIEIEDNAKGIDTAYMGQIFDPYFSTKEKNGTGLGLYMSKTIIEEHCKGELRVKNSKNGALFTIKFPLS